MFPLLAQVRRKKGRNLQETGDPDNLQWLQESGMRQPERIKVLVAHGDPLISAGLAATLGRSRDFEAVVCGLPLTSVHLTAARVRIADVVIADYESGLRLVASVDPERHRVMILTHSDSEAKICHALEQGVRGYVLLGCSVQDLIDSLRSVHLGGIALGPLVASRIADRMKQQALTRREGDILRQMMLGLSNKGIACRLALAVGTVKTHVKSILEKLNAASRTEAVAIAQRRGILREEAESLPRAGNMLPNVVRSLLPPAAKGASRRRQGDAATGVALA
jgi:DNA-binding NarL/FixJ family response regulator